MLVQFILNGVRVKVECEPFKSLLKILRQDFRLFGTKEGCQEGECSSCLVLANGLLCNSCLLPAYKLEAKHILTIEGFVKRKEYQDIEKAFLAKDLFCCGFCSPSLILAIESLLQNFPSADSAEIEKYLKTNLCHFSGTSQLIEAVFLAADIRRKRIDFKKLRSR